VWFYHVQTAFFAPYPSDADKLVLSTFAHDFKGNRFDFCHIDARVPEPPASSCAGFDAAVGHTLRLCSQVLRYPSSRVFDPVIILSRAENSASTIRCPHFKQVPSHVVSTRPFNQQLLPHSRALRLCHAQDRDSPGGSAIAWCGGSASHSWEDAISQLLGL
jgi:hypothetical protein